MPRMKRLSGDQVIAMLRPFGFEVHSQRGSHVKLARTNPNGHREIMTVPRHRADGDTSGRYMVKLWLWLAKQH